ncbi:hypothetical protein SAMN02799636_04278 [Methylobacterium sp. 275MFSha3.1]|uniref:hypothetical protein n=1 Tax=Methylobacterium sp. 275MFSha3.1 TaxID=1502746 RepID=UPI0008A7DE7C|nr:hypothetical protein [Methylobacterium sp. 275MFSha3.1]SEH88536.1 hypothetical protein SAMN02799636_04278 [Methylobacterium sp. 275MFSha3.1]
MYDGLVSRSRYPATMTDDADPVLEAVAALRAAGVAVDPIGDEPERWQISDLVFSDALLWRLAASRRLVEDGDSR